MSSRNQAGFTLVELLAALAITGLIIPVVLMSIFQINRGTVQIRNDVVIQQDIDSAAAFFTRDLSLAQTTNLACPGSSDTMRVDWIDETGWGADSGTTTHSAIYTLSAPDLQRTYDGTTHTIARRIESITFSRDVGSCDFITISITSTLGQRSEALTYLVAPRSDQPLETVA